MLGIRIPGKTLDCKGLIGGFPGGIKLKWPFANKKPLRRRKITDLAAKLPTKTAYLSPGSIALRMIGGGK